MLDKRLKKVGSIINILIYVAVIYLLAKHTWYIREILTGPGWWTLVIAIIIYLLFALIPIPIPTDPVTIIIGVSHGPAVAVIVAVIGNTLLTLVEYYMGIKIGENVDLEKMKSKMPLGLGKIPVDSPYVLIIGRLIPGGSKIISVLAGSSRVPMTLYVWTSIFTNLLGGVFLAYGGVSLISLIKFKRIFEILGI